MKKMINTKININDELSFNNEEIEEMASIGKYLAYVIIVFGLLFALFAFALPETLDKFMAWTKTVLFIVVGGGVAYITIKLIFKK